MLGSLQLPSPETTRFAQQALSRLKNIRSGRRSRLQMAVPTEDPSTEEEIVVELPSQAVDLILQLLGQLAEGNAVTIMPIHAELSTQQAADLLNVSRAYLIKLLDQGGIAHTVTGTHRHIKAADVLRYQHEREARARSAVRELTELGQQLSLS